MGQTERGSYVITVISRVAPSFKIGESGRLFEMEEPFERQVVMTLSKALTAANDAARSAVSTGRFDDFQTAVNEGVSSNLCDAICGIASGGASNKSLEINFSWSRSRPLSNPAIQSKSIFLSDSMDIFTEAARVFRETNTREGFELRGPVVKLERTEGATLGKVTVFAFVDEQPKKILMELEETYYNKAVQAHKDQKTIYCSGSLMREGRLLVLKNPFDLSIERDTDYPLE
ncbi:hypothetical protein MCHI_002200 [Candidatus Magnetoovum chiemensis]|nr:hypothetical protein MCHI_002200 [Candidatus Magnetoovum chiemensis]